MIFDFNNSSELASKILLLSKELKEIAQKKNFEITLKEDKSRVTTADFYADKKIKIIINDIFGKHKILSEEDTLENQQSIVKDGDYFIVDPIDGTESFIAGNDFCINLAYCVNNIPVFGMIALPMEDMVYYTSDNKIYSFDDKKNIEIKEKINITDIVIGRKTYHNKERFDKIIAKIPSIKNIFTRNAGIKYLSTIIGESSTTINFGPVKDWDIAMIFAMANILQYQLFDGNGNHIIFGINDFSHNNGIYLTQDKKTADLIKWTI